MSLEGVEDEVLAIVETDRQQQKRDRDGRSGRASPGAQRRAPAVPETDQGQGGWEGLGSDAVEPLRPQWLGFLVKKTLLKALCMFPSPGRQKSQKVRQVSREERRGAGITRPPGTLLRKPQGEGEAQGPAGQRHSGLSRGRGSRSTRPNGCPDIFDQMKLACRVDNSLGEFEGRVCIGQKLCVGEKGGNY